MARVYTAGQGLMLRGGYGGLAGVNNAVGTPEEAAAEVNKQIDKGVDIVKLWLDSELETMPPMPPAITQAIIDAAHRGNRARCRAVFYLEDAKRLVEQGIDGFVHSVRDQPVDQALIDGMKQRGTWQVAATLSREAVMFAYGSTPAFASDPFFTRGVSAATLDLIGARSGRRRLRRTQLQEVPRVLRAGESEPEKAGRRGNSVRSGHGRRAPGAVPRLFRALGTGADGRGRSDAAAGDHGGHAARRGIPEGRRPRDRCGGKWADFVVLGADPLREHPQYAHDSRRVHGRRRGAVNQSGERLTAAGSAHPGRAAWAIGCAGSVASGPWPPSRLVEFARTVQAIVQKHALIDAPVIVTNKGGGSGSDAAPHPFAREQSVNNLLTNTR